MRWHVGGNAPTFGRESELTYTNQTEKRLKSTETLHAMVAAAMAQVAES